MKTRWIVTLVMLGLASSLRAQPPGQAWQGQPVMGQIPNNGEISGLATSPNPIDNSRNWVMTGNVVGGKSFHGRVPYRAPGELSMPLGSSALDGFIRYSSPTNPASSGTSTTYYSTNRVASHRVPGMSQTVTPTFPQVSQVPPMGQDTTSAVELSDMKTLYPREAMPTTPRSSSSPALFPWGTLTTLTPTPESPQTSEQKPFSSQLLDKTPVSQPDPMSPIHADTQLTKLGQQPMVPSWKQPTNVQASDQSAVSSNEVMSELPDEQSLIPADDTDNAAFPSEVFPTSPALDKPKQSAVLSSSEALSMMQEMPQDGGTRDLPQASNEQILPLLHEARQNLQTGQAQAALEIYQRVACWRPRDPAVLAGQCVSNLALGYLMSSALYLSRWLEVEPEALQRPIDLAASIGSRDLLKQRVQQVEDYLAISEMPELYFLRAFISFKTNDLEQAQHDIHKALALSPTLKGANQLQAAISPQ